MYNLVIDEKKGTFTLTGNIQKPLRTSASGKSVLLNTSGGTMTTEAKYAGREVKINLNLTVANDQTGTVEASGAKA